MSVAGDSRDPCAGVIVLDRDGVINEDSEDYIRSAAQWRPLAGSLEAIAALHRAGFRIAVVTNQAGVGRGLMSEAALAQIHERMIAAVEQAGGRLSGVYYCPHRPDQGCECRKPRPGLLRQIEADFGCSLRGVPFIGDKRSDLDAAAAVGARPILVRTGYGEATCAALRSDEEVEVHADLAGAARALLAEAADR